jgi:hypothetical protein
MSFPFGGHPTLGRFVETAQEQGCTATLKTRARPDGRPYQTLVIENSHGGFVVIAEPDMDERLVPSTVSYYQRRLGISTAFAAEPDHHPAQPPNGADESHLD